MNTLDRRIAKLEQSQQPAVHRPPDMSSDEFFSAMMKALDSNAARASTDEFGLAAGPWLKAMTHTELREFAAALEAAMAARGDLQQGQTAQSNRRSA